MKYNPSKIEKKWQRAWTTKKLYVAKDKAQGKNFMLLTEFPYPSGNLHIGHWYAFSVPDILARYLRMHGNNVMYPIGFDAFGLPAENAAIKNQVNPRNWTESNISYMTKQLESMGASFDWSRVVSSIDPEYYRWTQWIFIKFFEKGLAYRSKTAVNWCPKDKTVLANEQVVNGCCERCDTPVVQKELTQWMLKITEYADKLIDDMAYLDWPDTIKSAQRNWIGRSVGSEIDFLLPNSKETIKVFTTRADTLYGVTYMVLAPEHPLVIKLTTDDNLDRVNKYLEEVRKKSEHERVNMEKEKTGVPLGTYAVNPVNQEKIPIWIADYVVARYGTGAVMAVPAHDDRDFKFAQKYKLPIREVIMPTVIDHINIPRSDKPTTTRKNVHAIVYSPERNAYLALRSTKFNWDTVIIGGVEEGESLEEAARREVREETGYTDLVFKKILGSPVQASYFAKHKDENRVAVATAVYFELTGENKVAPVENDLGEVIWVPTKDFVSGKMINSELPFWLDRLADRNAYYTGAGVLVNSDNFSGLSSDEARERMVESLSNRKLAVKKINYKLHDWVLSRQRYWGTPIPMIHCLKCGYQPVSEKELPIKLPKLEDYKPSADGRSPLAKTKSWLKTKCPHCGGPAERETDTMDTFVDSSWYFLRYSDSKNKKTFADKKKMASWLPVPLYIGGAEHNTMHLLYSRFFTKALHDLGLIEFNEPFSARRNHGLILGPDRQKMSKSRGNVIDPDNLVKQYGADTVRMYLAFLGPYVDQDYPWDPKGINGVHRFLNRVWAISESEFSKVPDTKIERVLNHAIKKVGEDIKELKFNTAISEMMKLLREIETNKISKSQFEVFLRLLSPFAPHVTEEIWQTILKHKKSIHLEKWPEYDENLLVEESIKIPIQINGKVREIVEVSAGITEDELRIIVLDNPRIKTQLNGQTPKKFVYIPGKVLNIVI